MGRYTGASCKLCRREGAKLFLKGERCATEKCAFERRGYAPGEHGRDRRLKASNYALQLREKQKARRIYGVMERQFRNYFHEAERQMGVTGVVLLQLLERRLDNVVFRMGFAPSRNAARQFVRHGHIQVNGRPVDIPSFLVGVGDEVAVREKSKTIPVIVQAVENRKGQPSYVWLETDLDKKTGRFTQLPPREDIPVPIQEQLIVELYSK
jgi:small subunit ribosomal protein S4